MSNNWIRIDNKEKEKEYINKGFHSLKLNETNYIYYTNNSIDKEIIIELKYNEEQPKLITEDNLIIDDYISKEITGKNITSYNDSKTKKYKEYNINQINNKDNFDNSYKKIFKNYYIKRYIGFENNKERENFISYNYYLFNEYKSYKVVEIWTIILFIFSFSYSIIYIILTLYNKDRRYNKFINCFFRFDSILFEYYIIYLITIYKDKDVNPDFLMKYEDLLNIFCKELSLFIFNRQLIIISFHFSTFSFGLKMLFIIYTIN